MGKPAFDLEKLRDKPWLTPPEAVALGYFGSVKAAARMRYQGRGPVFCQEEYGHRVRYSREALEEWLRSIQWEPQGG